MKHLIRSALVLAGVAGLAAARPSAPVGSETIVVTGGPYAGTYQARADRLLCFYAKDGDSYGATFHDEKANTPRSLNSGGIATFGTDLKKSISYDVSSLHVTITLKGKGADLAGVAKTKEGVSLRVTASCQSTMPV
jgi:hypothetical protein